MANRLVLLGSLVVFLAGCAPSKEDMAVARLQNGRRKEPGFFRLVNLTNTPKSLAVNGAEVTRPLDKGQASTFIATPSGDRTVAIMDGKAKDIEQKVSLSPKGQITFYLTEAGGKTTLHSIQAEPRIKDEARIQAVVVLLPGVDSAKVGLVGGASVDATATGLAPLAIDKAGAGKVSCQVGGKAVTVDADFRQGHVYSIVVYSDGGKPNVAVIQNSAEKPGLSGSAAA